MNTANQSGSGRGVTVALWIIEAVLLAAAVVVLALLLRALVQPGVTLVLWGLIALLMFILLVLAGREINGRYMGILIDNRNKISLSRLQITMWTVMVLSAFFTMALPRIAGMVSGNPRLTQAQALNIRFPEQLILAMGISAASFAGSSLIKTNKSSQQFKFDPQMTPDNVRQRVGNLTRDLAEAERMLQDRIQKEADRQATIEAAQQALAAAPANAALQLKLNAEEALFNAAQQDKAKAVQERDARRTALSTAQQDLTAVTEAQGLLHKNADPKEARWVDLFRGEEIGNYQMVDMSKVQMLFFTAIVVVTYAATVAVLLSDATTLQAPSGVSLPDFSPSLNALLGISHATYLSVKTIDK